ncbi:uncharacterized protein [Symphalangus syndactylus]|uniref:uncharacterized protein isoform X1 n=1 Tax=Symphalangus syndactylus TaxID=9590 RepID=UPI00300543CE
MDTLGKWGSWGWRGPTHSTDRLAGHPDATGCVEEDWSAWTLLSSSATGSVHCFLSQTPWARSVATAAPRMGDQLLFYVESRVYSDFLAVWSCYVGEVLVTLRSALLAGPLQVRWVPRGRVLSLDGSRPSLQQMAALRTPWVCGVPYPLGGLGSLRSCLFLMQSPHCSLPWRRQEIPPDPAWRAGPGARVGAGSTPQETWSSAAPCSGTLVAVQLLPWEGKAGRMGESPIEPPLPCLLGLGEA